MEKFDPDEAFKLVEKEKITLFPGAPTHYILMLSRDSRKNYDLGSLRAGLTAGYTPPEGLITKIEQDWNDNNPQKNLAKEQNYTIHYHHQNRSHHNYRGCCNQD